MWDSCKKRDVKFLIQKMIKKKIYKNMKDEDIFEILKIYCYIEFINPNLHTIFFSSCREGNGTFLKKWVQKQ